MAKAIIMGGGGGGVGSDELTATASDVLKGQTYVGSDTNDETGTGTLALTGNATNDQVLTGQTFYNNNAKTIQTGNMPNQGSTSISVGRNESKTIPAGYYNGQGKVNGPSMTNVPGKTITPTESQQTAISAGQYAVGNILVAGYSSGTVGSTVPRIGARTLYATTSTITAFPTGNYATGNTTVAAISASIPTNSILNTATVTVSNGQTTILSSKATIASQGGLTYTPTTSIQTASVSGKYMTGNIVINPIPSTYKQVGSTTSFFDFGGARVMKMSSAYNPDEGPQVPGKSLSQWKECATISKGYNPGRPSGNGVNYVLFRPINITAIGKNYKMEVFPTPENSVFCSGWCVLGCNDGDGWMSTWASEIGLVSMDEFSRPKWNLTNFNYKWLFFSWCVVSYGSARDSYTDIGFKLTAI